MDKNNIDKFYKLFLNFKKWRIKYKKNYQMKKKFQLTINIWNI